MTGEREHRAFRSTAVFTLFNYVGMVASFVSVPLLLRWLGREEYGLMLTALAFMNYLAFADAGLNWSSIVLVSGAHGRGDRAAVASVFRHSAVLGVGSAALAAGGALAVYLAARHGWRMPMFPSNGRADALVLVVAVQCAVSLSVNSVYGVFQGLQEGYWVAFYQGCARVVGATGTLVAAYFYRDPAIALSANAVALLGFGLLAAVHMGIKHPWVLARGSWVDADQYRVQLRTGAKSFGLQVARTVQGTLPVMVIGAVSGAAAVPLYSVPATLLGVVFDVFISWNMSLQPAYGASWAANDRPWVIAAFRRTLSSILLIGVVVGAGFVTAAPGVIGLWTRGVLHPTHALCASVAAVLGVKAIAYTVQYCLVGINQHQKIALIELLHTVCAIACAVLAVHATGPAGIGLGIVVAYGATASWLGFRDLAGRLGSFAVVPKLPWIVGLTLAGFAGLSVGFGFMRLMPHAGPIAAALEAAAGAVLAASTVIVAGIALRVQSAAECRMWGQRLVRAPGQFIRSSPRAAAA